MKALLLAAGAAVALVLGACRNDGASDGAAGRRAAPPAVALPAVQESAAPATETAPPEDPAATSSPIDLRGIGHDVGSPGAKVTVVEFADFGCPYCGQFAEQVWPTIRKEYVETGKVRWKFVPFVMGMFPNGAEAARAGECAAAQGEPAFWSMNDRLFQRQPEWKHSSDPAALFGRYASELRLNAGAFNACYRADGSRARTAASNAASEKLAVRVTPTFFVNGARLEGALPLQDFRMVLQQSGAR